MEFVLVGVLFVLAMIGLVRPYFGLLSLLIVMELQPGELYPSLDSLHLERVVAALVIVAFLIHGEKLRFPAPTRWFLAFYGAMIVSIPLAFWRGNAVESCFTFLEIVVFVILATALLTTELRIKWFIATFVLLADWMSGSALWSYAHGGGYYAMGIYRLQGLTSSAGGPDTLAATLVFSMPLCGALMVRSNPMWMRLIGLASIGVYMVTIVVSGSRGVAAGVVLLAFLLLFRKAKNLVYLPIVVALCPLVWMAIPQQYKARYESMDHLKNDESYQNRVLSWEGGIAMFESNPLTGIGAGDYTDANGVKFWPGNGRKVFLNAHSLYFKLLGELGLVGIFTFGGYLICVFRLNFRLSRELSNRNASKFLQVLPGMFNIVLCLLLFEGYAAHNLYRDTWFLIGAMAASVNLLPILQQPVAVPELAESGAIALPATAEGLSPAMLPALRRQIAVEGPRA